MKRPRSRSRCAGSSVLETLVASACFASLLGILSVGIVRALDARCAAATRDEVELRAANAIARVMDQMEGCDLASIAEDLGSPSGSSRITFRRVVGWNDDAPVLGPLSSIGLRPSAADPVNGVDDDRDGVVDQCDLTSGAVGDPVESALARGVPPLLEGEFANARDDNANTLVDEPGFSVSRVGATLRVWLTLCRRDQSGRVCTVTVTGQVRPAQ